MIDQPLPVGWVRDVAVDFAGSFDLNNSRIFQTESSGALRDKLIEILDSSKDIICISSFLIADNLIIQAMLNASKRGVRVYLLTASEIHLKKEVRDDDAFSTKLVDEHIRMLDELAGRVLVRTGENFHSKFVLVDPKSEQAMGFLLTANLTSEALTRNVEIGVKLNSSEVNGMYRQFLIGFWLESSHELLKPSGLSKVVLSADTKYELPESHLCTTSQTHTLKEAVKNLIGKAKSEIIISSFGIDVQHETTKEIVMAAKSGKKVRILARPRNNKSTMGALTSLVEAGAEIRGHPWLHAKCILVDLNEGWTGLIMTANIESKGLDEGFESGIPVHRADATNLHLILEDWWQNFPKTFFTNKKQGEIEGDVSLWRDETLTTISIQKKFEEDIGEFEAKSFDEMEIFTPTEVSRHIQHLSARTASKENTLYHEHILSWTILPPKLPANLKKDSMDGDIPIYKRGEDVFVAIQRKDQLSKAKKLAVSMHAKIVFDS